MNRRIKTYGLLCGAFVLMMIGADRGMAYAPCSDAAIQSQKVTYLPISGTLNTNALDPRADPDGVVPYNVQLRGTLHYKFNDGENVIRNRPVLIFNHGHEQGRNEICNLIQYFTDRKWVVFAPLRRGHYLDVNDDGEYDAEDGDIRSTGIYVDHYVIHCSRLQSQAQDSTTPYLYRNSAFCRPNAPLGDEHTRSAVELGYLSEQRIDVRDQIAYIKSLPAYSTERINVNWKLADAKSIVILGHSYGGALTVFANSVDYGQSAGVDVSGAELSWSNDDEPYWKLDLMNAMPDQKRPIFFVQPKNGLDLSPTKVLFGIGVDYQFRTQAAIYPPAPCTERIDGNETFPPCSNTDTNPEGKQIHSTFIGRMSQIERWGPAVIEFAKRNQR